MKQEGGIVRSKSCINYTYATVRLTQSRINKGLIAIPITLARWFPDHNADIQIYLNDSSTAECKRYSSYSSSTKESRIGGVGRWFQQNHLKSGDEIVIQLIDKSQSVYRLIPEEDFVATTEELQTDFDKARSEPEASEKLARLSDWTNVAKDKVALNEYQRLLVASPPAERGLTARKSSRARESTPPSLRTLLGHLYEGHCQVCDFWFLKTNDEPYFEIHHLDARKGHHPKNLVVVCGNCHNQFEYASVTPEFDDDQWLIRVYFNAVLHRVNQIALNTRMASFSKELFV